MVKDTGGRYGQVEFPRAGLEKLGLSKGYSGKPVSLYLLITPQGKEPAAKSAAVGSKFTRCADGKDNTNGERGDVLGLHPFKSAVKNQGIRAMKHLLFTISLLLPLLAVQAEERPAPTESFATFWAGFKSAVAKDDKEAVAAATDLRFFDQNKHLAKDLAKAAFIRDYPSYFTKEVKKCFATAPSRCSTGIATSFFAARRSLPSRG